MFVLVQRDTVKSAWFFGHYVAYFLQADHFIKILFADISFDK